VLEIQFLEEFAKEIKEGDPVIRRAVLHEKHVHLVRIDAQGGDRGNENLDLYEGAGQPAAAGGVKIEYTCEECKKKFSFVTKKLIVEKLPVKDELGVPTMKKGYTCIHVHPAGADKHAIHVRLTPQGKLQFAKYVQFAALMH
jgi:hypothetical protein